MSVEQRLQSIESELRKKISVNDLQQVTVKPLNSTALITDPGANELKKMAFDLLSTLTPAQQAELDKIPFKADLVNGKLAPEQIPDLAITDFVIAAETTLAAFITNNAAYTYQKGDTVIITEADGNVATYLYKGGDKTLAASYSQINATSIPISAVKLLQAALDARTLKGGTELTAKEILDKIGGLHNTVIGGVGATINTRALLAAQLTGLVESDISNFFLVGNNVYAQINKDYSNIGTGIRQIALTRYEDPEGRYIGTPFSGNYLNLTNLTKIIFNGITNITGNSTFNGSTALSYFEARKLQEIANNNIFFGTALTTVITPSLKIIAGSTFQNITVLTSLNLPLLEKTSGANGQGAFVGCGVISFILPNIRSISYDFENTNSATTIYIPNCKTIDVTTSPEKVFSGNLPNKTITVHSDLATSNNGSEHAALAAARAGGATIVYHQSDKSRAFTGNIIPLGNVSGSYQTGTPNTATSYTFATGSVLGGKSKLKINAVSEPTFPTTHETLPVVKITGSAFTVSTDMYLFFEREEGRITYKFGDVENSSFIQKTGQTSQRINGNLALNLTPQINGLTVGSLNPELRLGNTSGRTIGNYARYTFTIDNDSQASLGYMQFVNVGGSSGVHDYEIALFNGVDGAPRRFIIKGTNGNAGFGVDNPTEKLVVAGNIKATGSAQVGDNTAAASVANEGAIRYRKDANNSYMEMSMQTGASTYAWVIIKQNTF